MNQFRKGRPNLVWFGGLTGLLISMNAGAAPEFSKMVVEHDPGWDIVRVILPTSSAPTGENIKYLSNPPRVQVTFSGRLKGLPTKTTSYPDRFLKSIRVSTASKGRKVVLTATLAAPVPRNVKARFYRTGRQKFYHIDIPRPARYRSPLWTWKSVEDAKRRGMPIVVVDPGHGGYDPGTASRYRKSMKEKSVVLGIGREVHRILRRNGKVYPVLTRSGDFYPTLDERVDLTRDTGADLFVSIHADWSSRRSVKGFQVWVIDRSRRDVGSEARKLLEFGLRDRLAGYSFRKRRLVLDRQERFVVEETDRAAKTMVAALDKIPKVDNRGVTTHPKSLRVLRHNFAPAFLIETGFLSNKSDTIRLADKSHKDRMARAIAEGIESYLLQRRHRHTTPPLKPELRVAQANEPPRTYIPLSGETVSYKVRKGDTLIGLARKHGIRTKDILLASGFPLSRQFLYTDEEIRIPLRDTKTPDKASSIRPRASSSGGARVLPETLRIGPGTLSVDRPSLREYVVRPGDTLLGIAHSHSLNVRELLKLNGWSEGRRPKAGEKMVVPDIDPDPARRALEKLEKVWDEDENGPRGKTLESGKPPEESGTKPNELRLVDYRVKPGDTLSGIAEKFSVQEKDLRRYNGIKKDLIRAGESLRIPMGKAEALEHKVDRGDTLEKISLTYGTTIDEIRKLNDLRSDRIVAGDFLRIR